MPGSSGRPFATQWSWSGRKPPWTGTGGAGGDDTELHRRECEGCPRPRGVPETLQWLGGTVREGQGTVRRGDGGHRPAVSQEREAATRS